MRLLEFHAKYAEFFAKLLMQKAIGNDDEARKIYEQMRDEIGKGEIAFERWYDQSNFFNHISVRVMKNTQTGENESIESV